MLSFQDALRNERWNAVEVFLATPAVIMSLQYLPVLVTRLGASPIWIGALTSGGAFMLTVAASLAPLWLQRVPDFRRAFGIPLLLWRSPLLIVPLLLLWLGERAAEAIVTAMVALHLIGGVLNVALTSFLPRMTLPERLAGLVSLRWAVFGFGNALFSLPLALLLNAVNFPSNYMLAFGAALVAALLGFAAAMQIHVAPKPAHEHVANTLSPREVLAHAPARGYLALSLMVHLLVNAPVPLITLHLVRGLGMSDWDFGIYNCIFWASLAASGLVVPRLARRLHHGRLFALSMFGIALQVALMGVSVTLPQAWLSALVGGLAGILLQVSSYGLLVQTAPAGRYETYASMHVSVINFAIFLGPLLTSTVVDRGLAVTTGLLVMSALSAVLAAWMMLRCPLLLRAPRQPAPAVQ